MQLRSQRWKNLATMLFIGVILFNYVNSTMFWHNHLVDLSSVWVTANVKDNLVSGIAKGQAVDIEYGGQTIVSGKVCYVGEILD